jgi:membrane protein implicated in regulation of membrane protease activity
MLWWQWILLGLILVGAELITPGGFYVIFFGVAALAIGVLLGLGFAEPLWVQWSLFSILSIVSLLLFRDSLVTKRQANDTNHVGIDSLIGELALPLETIQPGRTGKAELRGTVWTARNADAVPVGTGERCRVSRVEGLMISLRRESWKGE